MSCGLKLSVHAEERIATRAGLTMERVLEAHCDSNGLVFKLKDRRIALLARSEDGGYLTMIIEVKRSCDLLITARPMDARERKRYRKGR